MTAIIHLMGATCSGKSPVIKAMNYTAFHNNEVDPEETTAAMRLKRAVNSTVYGFNDAATHKQVMEAFDNAIHYSKARDD